MKVFRKIRRLSIGEGNFNKYLLYAIGEILIVVIGILFALQVNNFNTTRIKKQDEIKSYQNIKRQISEDLNELNQVIEFNNFYFSQFEFAINFIVSKNYTNIDTLAPIAMNLSKYSDFNQSSNIYETLVNSGDIKLLKNSEILSNLQKLEMTYNEINKLEDIHWDIIIREYSPEIKGVINYATLEVIKPKKLLSIEVQNIFIECLYLIKGKDLIYNQALAEINIITEMIEKELDQYYN